MCVQPHPEVPLASSGMSIPVSQHLVQDSSGPPLSLSRAVVILIIMGDTTEWALIGLGIAHTLWADRTVTL